MTALGEKGALAAAELAHEIRNILTIIEGAAYMLRRILPADGTELAIVGDLLAASERAAAASKRLMELAREETAREYPADLCAAVSGLTAALQRVVPERIAMSIDIERGVMHTPVSARATEQIVMNLVTNAVEAMPGGGRLAIRVARVPLVGLPQLVGLTVSDTGVGMDEATRRRCFDPFFTTKKAGNGIGLHTVRDHVDEAGGRISIDTTPGVGTTVGVYLPILPAG
jgi:two-component system cell cycle sensor histidine kinase/response regulator CckA